MARVETDDHGTIWYYNELGQLHRDCDLPSIIYKDGTIAYFKNNHYHRVAGPAWAGSNGIIQYWIHGKFLTKEEFEDHPLVREYRLKKVVEDLLSG